MFLVRDPGTDALSIYLWAPASGDAGKKLFDFSPKSPGTDGATTLHLESPTRAYNDAGLPLPSTLLAGVATIRFAPPPRVPL